MPVYPGAFDLTLSPFSSIKVGSLPFTRIRSYCDPISVLSVACFQYSSWTLPFAFL
jgi:hypothetical protein